MLEDDGKAFTGGEDGWEVEVDAALFFGECAEWVGVSAGVSEDFEDEAYDGCLSVYGLLDGFFGVVLCGFVLFEFFCFTNNYNDGKI